MRHNSEESKYLDMGIEAIVPHSREQVIHDERQVRNPEDLEVGRVYDFKNTIKGAGNGLARIVANPSPEDVKRFVIELTKEPRKGMRESVYFTDMGLLPYEGGTWNPVNYILPVEEEKQPK